MKGASEYILDCCDSFHNLKDNKVIPIDDQLKAQCNEAINKMATKSLRTIGLCYKKVNFSDINTEEPDDKGIHAYEKEGFTLLGIAGIKDIIRTGVVDAIRLCHEASVDVKMVTGDNKVTARAIAEEINLITPQNRE